MAGRLGLNVYDFHARLFDPATGRTTTLDPKSEMFYSMSPYSFLNNNGLRYIDPDGKMSIDGLDNEYKIYKKGGEVQSVEYVSDKGGNKVDFITEVNLDKRSIDPSAYKSYYIPVQNETETRPTPFGSQDGQLIYNYREPGYNLDVKYKAQSQAIQPMEFDSPFFVVGGVAKAFTSNRNVTVYRAFGGDSRAQGFSWTTINPTTVKDFRNLAGLPSGGASGSINTADFLIKGQVRNRNIIKSRSALPLDGNTGGLPELLINPKNVKLTDFKVLNP